VDTLPADVEFVAASGGGAYDAGRRAVVWKLGSLPVNGSKTLTLTARLASTAPLGSALVNRAELTADLTLSPPLATWPTLVTP
jgi:hypothetical protein